jgi:hypothetical protein
VAPPVLYQINDLTGGRSGRRDGARIVSVGKPEPLPGTVASGFEGAVSGPRIITLTAK